jgi:hypothetical protein
MKFFIVPVFFILFIGCNQPIKSQNKLNLKGRPQKVTETLSYYEKSDYGGSFISITTKSIYTFDKNDNEIVTELYGVYDSLIGKMKYHYDANNRIKEIESTDSAGKFFSKSEFFRNEKNQIVKTIITEPNDKRERISHFGTSDLPESGKELDKNGETIRSWKLEYNDADLVSVSSTYYPDQTMNSQTLYLYNTNKDQIQASEKNYKGKIISQEFYKYKYDDKKNWVEKKVYDQNNDLKTTSKREIIYWKN